MQKILVIAPHPDDEVLGCGGAIRKFVNQKDEVYLLIVTEAYEPKWSREFIDKRPEEIARANEILGIKNTFFLKFPAVKLDQVLQRDLNDAIKAVVDRVGPDIVFIPHKGDLNRDHQLVHESSLVACRPVDTSIRKVLSYEVLSETEWGVPFVPNIYLDISETIYAKLDAFNAYQSELRPEPHPRCVLAVETLARKRGFEAGMKYAEAFLLIRGREI